MTDIHPATPMGSPAATTPGQAASPVEVAVAELVKMAHNRNGASQIAGEGISSRSQERARQLEGEAIGLDAAAALVRERLAPAWAALVRERDNFRHAHRNWAAEGNRLHDENASLRAELEAEQHHLDGIIAQRDGAASDLTAERAECERLRASSVALQGDLSTARQERDAAREELAKLSDSCHLLARTLSMHVRSEYALWIDLNRGDVKSVHEALAEGTEGFDGPEWNGTETGTEWLERAYGEDWFAGGAPIAGEALGLPGDGA